MLDILDMLEQEKGCVQITLTSGDVVKGYADIIFWIEDEEDDAGEKVTKAIWFRASGSREYVAFTEKDIRSYKRV